MFEHKLLVNRQHGGKKKTIECRKSEEDVILLELLDGLKVAHLPNWATNASKRKEETRHLNTEVSEIESSRMRFAIAVSFPSEHRDFVEKVAEQLSNSVGRDRVLYDKHHEAELARLDLDVYLPRLYREQAELVVVFLCAEYEQKRWCNLEWRHIRQLIATADDRRIMLVSFGPPGDLSGLGIVQGDGYADIGNRTPAAIAELILQRFGQSRSLPEM